MAFEIVQVPHDEDGIRSWLERYKSFRLHALKTEPAAFGSTYAREVAWDDEVWYSRLKDPDAFTFMALQDNQVVASLTTVGHLKYGVDHIPMPHNFKASHDSPIDSSDTLTPLHYRIFGMYTSPEYRCQGIGRALIERAIEAGKGEAQRLGRPYVGSIAADDDNKAATALYQRAGFVIVRTAQFGDTERRATILRYAPEINSAPIDSKTL